MIRYLYILVVTFVCLCLSGCGFMLPVAKSRTESPWHNFDQAKAALDKVVPYQSTRDDLVTLSLDPFQNTNIEVLTYLDLVEVFMPNASFRKEDLVEGVRNCLDVQEKCYGYRIAVTNMESRRFGSVFLDLFNFKRKSHKTGWKFNALLVLQEDIVVYKINGGKPKIDEYLYKRNPLGPFQESEAIVKDIGIETSFD
ncbi:MAG: hypothetical protein H8E41_07150 [Desulfobulbaceae bacterium]|uniref:Uncharacterized protein n=1 Tax=Candidatus Desulfobia pelagia TaxID=2841692 RepID=A0A8J6NDQ0_9BACT|nr:hypothetical protein [Candidatus Desulfobia pelagia]